MAKSEVAQFPTVDQEPIPQITPKQMGPVAKQLGRLLWEEYHGVTDMAQRLETMQRLIHDMKIQDHETFKIMLVTWLEHELECLDKISASINEKFSPVEGMFPTGEDQDG